MKPLPWILRRLALLLLAAGSLRAHDAGISMAQAELRAGELVLTTGFAPADAQVFLPAAERREGGWTEADFEAVRDRLIALAPQLWEVRAGERPLVPRATSVELLPGDNVSFRLVYPRPGDAERITFRAPRLGELPGAHRQFLIVSDERGSTLTKKLLSARDPVLEVPVPAATPARAVATSVATEPEESEFWGFLRLGVAHIWMGFDHLLFLFALLIVCRSFRSIAAIITCFTLAHSITLALATLDVVSLPARLVEPAIAASIVFVGAENLWRRGEEPPGRWALTFAFGLIHGFGFASVLRDLGVAQGGRGVALPLFSFNLGVELGQIAIAAVVLPLVWRLRRHAWFVGRGVIALSVIVAAAGMYWLLQRTVFA